ncbi:hypothetical protein BH23GEM3_BH23GEM3_04080 [soil metagenome]
MLTLATGAVTTVLSDGAVNWYPAWSPDGAWIMHSKNATGSSSPAGSEIWAIRADGTGAILVKAAARF